MNFIPDPDLVSFREEVRRFLREKLPADLANKPNKTRSPRAELRQWQAILSEQGWGAPSWAREDLGTGWTAQQCLAFEEECAAVGAPSQDVFGQRLLGPVVNKFGSAEQKAEHLPPTLSGERTWCQGFSEPGSGSDLASLRTRAERDGDHYVVSGQKIWTSYAHESEWIFLLVRTSTEARKQAGISFLLVDMKSPGVTVRPIYSIDGCHHLNEVFFDNVRVPVANRIGDEGAGWEITKFLLNNEHATIADLPALRGYMRQLETLAVSLQVGEQRLIDQPAFALRLARFEAEIEALAMMVARAAAMEQEGNHTPAALALGSMLKLRATELQQRVNDLLVESLGDLGAIRRPGANDDSFASLPDFAGGVGSEMFFRRAATIYGGSSEVQRGIIAKTMFNL